MKTRFRVLLAVCLLCRSTFLSAQTTSAPPDADKILARAAAYVDRHIAGKDEGGKRNLFTKGDFNAGKGWVRNPDLWCADLDLTCFSPWNSTEHNLQAGTLITRRHILLANHFSNPYTGTPPMIPGLTTIEFVARDNTVYTRTIRKLTRVKNTDVLIGTLDQDLPDKITPAQIFPADHGATIPRGTPLILTGQDKAARVGEFAGNSGPLFAVQPAAAAGRAAWATPGLARVGDSGSPIFLPLGGRAVLVGHFFFPGGGPLTGLYIAEINAITGPDYPVQEANLAPRE